MEDIYLDNSATTIVKDKVAKAIMKMLTEYYGNPSSLHSKGLEAEKVLRKSREIIAKSIGSDINEIYFTSGGTEANNLAILGASESKKRSGNRIIISSIEHSSIMESADNLEKMGFEVIRLNPDSFGNISKEQLINTINSDTILVSIMMVNNEVGSIQPVEEIKNIVKLNKSPALIHTDAVQAFGKIPIKVKKLGVDLMTLTAHKIHGPKGVGALYVSKNVHISPRTFGGEQEKKLRPGTEPIPLIAGFGAAVEDLPNLNLEYNKIKDLRDYAIQSLIKIPGIQINSPENALPYIINFSVDGIRSETMMHHLASMGIYVSSGSACAKGRQSHVLKAIGLSDRRIMSAIRVSFCRYNTKEEIDKLIYGLKCGINRLVKS